MLIKLKSTQLNLSLLQRMRMDEDATDTKPSNVQVFHLAEIPSTTETVKIIDEEDDQS